MKIELSLFAVSIQQQVKIRKEISDSDEDLEEMSKIRLVHYLLSILGSYAGTGYVQNTLNLKNQVYRVLRRFN